MTATGDAFFEDARRKPSGVPPSSLVEQAPKTFELKNRGYQIEAVTVRDEIARGGKPPTAPLTPRGGWRGGGCNHVAGSCDHPHSRSRLCGERFLESDEWTRGYSR